MSLFYKLTNKVSPLFHGKSFQGKASCTPVAKNLGELMKRHFEMYSNQDHPCRSTLGMALERLEQNSACIVETGSSAYGTNSSLLFDAYVSTFGGEFSTVDIRMEPALRLLPKVCCRTSLHVNDSVSFLRDWSNSHPDARIDLLYLDSWDVDWAAPDASALHGLSEFLAISKHLHVGSLMLIDDTPHDKSVMDAVQPAKAESFSRSESQNGYSPGKGAFVKILLEHAGRGKLVHQDYQMLWKF